MGAGDRVEQTKQDRRFKPTVLFALEKNSETGLRQTRCYVIYAVTEDLRMVLLSGFQMIREIT